MLCHVTFARTAFTTSCIVVTKCFNVIPSRTPFIELCECIPRVSSWNFRVIKIYFECTNSPTPKTDAYLQKNSLNFSREGIEDSLRGLKIFFKLNSSLFETSALCLHERSGTEEARPDHTLDKCQGATRVKGVIDS
jgi:hypothetical protein